MMALRIGVAGLRRGMGFVRVFGNHRECELAAVCDVEAGRAKAVAEEFGAPLHFEDFSEMCRAEIDAIVVATPAPLHVAHALEALSEGKHVMSEVPAAWDLEEAEELARGVERSGLKYMFAENMCYFAYIETYEQMVKRGDIGKPIYAEGEYVHDCRPLMHDRFDGITPGSESGLTWRASLPPIHYCTHDLGPILEIMNTRVVSAVGMHTGSNVEPQWGTIDMEVASSRPSRGLSSRYSWASQSRGSRRCTGWSSMGRRATWRARAGARAATTCSTASAPRT